MEQQSNKITLEEVTATIFSWSLRFSEKSLSPSSIEFLADEFLEDLEDEGVTMKQFKWAAKYTRKHCQYFPKMADILEAVQEYRSNPPKGGSIAEIEYQPVHELSEEEMEKNKIKMKICVYAVAHRMQFEEAEELYNSGLI